MTITIPTMVPTTWSFSALKNFEQCPARFAAVQEKKQVKDLESEAIQIGQEVHRHLQDYVQDGKPVPPGLAWLAWVVDVFREKATSWTAEQELALTAELEPCAWRSFEACWRGKADFVAYGDDAIRVVDWKSGKPTGDDTQLRLLALALLRAHPEHARVFAYYIHTSKRYHVLEVTRERALDVVDEVNPRLQALHEARRQDHWPEKPGSHCRWCPVAACRFNERAAEPPAAEPAYA